MTLGGIAIDCGWLIQIDEHDFDGRYAAMALIVRMCDQGIPLLLDYDRHIQGEYDRNFAPGSHARHILTKLLKNSPLYVSGAPSEKCRSILNQAGFDPADLPYVGVAERASGVYLTHEEKHLESTRCEKCLDGCGVKIVGSAAVDQLLTN